MTTAYPGPPAFPTIQSRHELDAVVENIVQMQLEHAALEQAQEHEIAATRQKFRAPLAELERYLTHETAWVETWAKRNPAWFVDRPSLALTHATIGYRVSPPRVERASRKWTWTEISQKLGEVAWGRRYLRQPSPEVNKEAILANRAEFDPAELRQVGVKIVQETRFYITPHRTTEATEESALEEAA